jgi:hypothetical protein
MTNHDWCASVVDARTNRGVSRPTMMTTCVSGLLATMLLSPPLSRCRTVTFEHQATEADEVTVYDTGNVDDSGTFIEGTRHVAGRSDSMANSRRRSCCRRASCRADPRWRGGGCPGRFSVT